MSAETVVYLDSSAIVKLVVAEPETPALLAHLALRPVRVTSSLARVEVIRAVRAHGKGATRRAKQILAATNLLTIDQTLLDAAADLPQDGLRSIDAIHVASALTIADDLSELITYDRRMADAAIAAGISTGAPA